MDRWLPDLGIGYGDAYTLLADAIERAVRAGHLKAGRAAADAPRIVAASRRGGQHRHPRLRRSDPPRSPREHGRSRDLRQGRVPAVGAGNERAEERAPARAHVCVAPVAGERDRSQPEPPASERRGRRSRRRPADDWPKPATSTISPSITRRRGALDHRVAGAAWLDFLGIAAEPEDVIVVAGGQTALLSILLAFARRGDVVLAESLTWPGALAVAQSLGIRFEPVALDAEGTRARRLRRGVPPLVAAPRLHHADAAEPDDRDRRPRAPPRDRADRPRPSRGHRRGRRLWLRGRAARHVLFRARPRYRASI